MGEKEYNKFIKLPLQDKLLGIAIFAHMAEDEKVKAFAIQAKDIMKKGRHHETD